MAPTSPPLLGRVAGFFAVGDWPYERVEEETILHLTYRDDHAEFDCYAQTLEDDHQFLFYSIAPFHVPEERIAEVAEFVTRANFGLPIGNFELDLDDGDLRFKTSIDAPDESLSNDIIESIVGANLAVMIHYLAGIRAVAFGESSAASVIAELES